MNDAQTQLKIVPMARHHARAAARLHRNGIDTGLLSYLGPMFLRQLYAAIPCCPSGFGFVAREGKDVLGFIACSESTGRLYKQALLRRSLLMALPLFANLTEQQVARVKIELIRAIEQNAQA